MNGRNQASDAEAWQYGNQATNRAPLREDGAFYGTTTGDTLATDGGESEDQASAYLFPAGTAMYFDRDGEQIAEFQKDDLAGLHAFVEAYPDAPVYSAVWGEDRHEMSEQAVQNRLRYVRRPDDVEPREDRERPDDLHVCAGCKAGWDSEAVKNNPEAFEQYRCPACDEDLEDQYRADGGDGDLEECSRCPNQLRSELLDGGLCPKCAEKRRVEQARIEQAVQGPLGQYDDPAAYRDEPPRGGRR